MSQTTPRNRGVQFFAVLVAVLIVTSISFGAVGATSLDGGELATDGDDAVEAADEVYELDDGVVAVYEGEDELDDDDLSAVEFSGDVTTGLVNAVVEGEHDGDEDVVGEVNLLLDEEQFVGAGDLTVDHYGEISDLDVNVEGEQSSSNSYLDASGSVEVSDAVQPMVAGSTGTIDVSSDSMQLDAGVNMEYAHGMGDETEQVTETVIETTGNDVVVSQTEENRVVHFNAQEWESEENVEQMLQMQYDGMAQELGGHAEVTVHSHEFHEETETEPATVDVDYTIELVDVRDSLGDVIVEELEADPAIDLDAEESAALADAFNEIEINEISVTDVETGDGMSIDVTADIENYEDALQSYMHAAVDDDVVEEEDIEEMDAAFEAQSASDLQQTIEWDVGVDTETAGSDVEFDVQYTTENWDSYIDEYSDRVGDTPNDMTFSLTATGDSDTVDVQVDGEVERGDFIDQAIEYIVADMEDDPSVSDSDVKFFEALNDADLQVAKSDIIFAEDTVEFRASGQFDELDALQELGGDDAANVAHIMTDDSDGELNGYVYLDESLDDVENSDYVDADTQVYAADEHDEEFPRMDTEEVADYLGVEHGELTDDTSDDSIPGFGVPVAVAALAAILGAALFLARRQQGGNNE